MLDHHDPGDEHAPRVGARLAPFLERRPWDLPPGPVRVSTLSELIASAPTRYGNWRQSAIGRPIWPLDPRPGDFAIIDLALALSALPRYGGASHHHYSVAQHSFLCSYYGDPRYARHKLTHDLAEAITGCDMPAPLKREPALATYCAIEDWCQLAVWRQLGVDPTDLGDTHEIDRAILEPERRRLLAKAPLPWPTSMLKLDVYVERWDQWVATHKFMWRFRELFPEYPIDHDAEVEQG